VLEALQQPITPVMVKVVGAPTKEVSGLDILVGGLGLTALLLLGAILLGLLIGGLLIGYKRLRPSNRFNGQTAGSTGLNLNSYPPGA
jgi:hypothetical protein